MKHKVGDIWVYKNGETYIRTEKGTKSYHRYLVEEYLGHPIPDGLIVHHIDFNHYKNTLENFLLIPSSLHIYIHRCNATKFSSNLHLFKNI